MERKKFFGFTWNEILGRLVVVFAFFIFSANSCEQVNNPPAKTSAYWTSPTMGIEQAKALARHDLVIVDMENMINNPAALKLMKSLNRDLKLICYSNPMEFFYPMTANRPIQKRWLQEVLSHYPKWFLKTGDGKNAVFWPGMVMMNLSSACPAYDGIQYKDWIADKLLKEVLNNSVWDGYFMDNGGANISWVQKNKSSQFDINGNGLANTPYEIDNYWAEGIYSFFSRIRQVRGKNFILMANKGSLEFLDLLDGRMFEAFPNDYLGDTEAFGWYQSMYNAEEMQKAGLKYIIFQVPPYHLEFGFASAMLLDNAYIAISQDNPVFPPLLEIDLGKPIEKATVGIYTIFRHFENGSVEVMPGSRFGKISPLGPALSLN